VESIGSCPKDGGINDESLSQLRNPLNSSGKVEILKAFKGPSGVLKLEIQYRSEHVMFGNDLEEWVLGEFMTKSLLSVLWGFKFETSSCKVS
jgi:hypothetical protein